MTALSHSLVRFQPGDAVTRLTRAADPVGQIREILGSPKPHVTRLLSGRVFNTTPEGGGDRNLFLRLYLLGVPGVSPIFFTKLGPIAAQQSLPIVSGFPLTFGPGETIGVGVDPDTGADWQSATTLPTAGDSPALPMGLVRFRLDGTDQEAVPFPTPNRRNIIAPESYVQTELLIANQSEVDVVDVRVFVELEGQLMQASRPNVPALTSVLAVQFPVALSLGPEERVVVRETTAPGNGILLGAWLSVPES